ncbi:hypothetical protein ACQX6Q_12165, partial [Salmonella enterica]
LRKAVRLRYAFIRDNTCCWPVRLLCRVLEIQLPSVIGGYPPSTLKIKMVAKISAFTGRAIPVVGWIILASDVSQIAYRTVGDYSRIARGSDKIW